jgi:arsenate reductase-like glutaredoxin family protein
MFPVAVFYDEPHRYLRSADIWKKLAVESRAYRIAFYWLFHSFDQMTGSDSKLLQIIKDAGPHYILFNSSEQTYEALKKQIAPFSIEEALRIKKRHAICILRVGESRLNPLMVNMTVT